MSIVPVKTYNVGVLSDDRTTVLIAINGKVFSLSAPDAKALFQQGLATIEQLCGAHAATPP